MAPTPEMIEATRRAAALWTHWQHDGERAVDGGTAILEEVAAAAKETGNSIPWEMLVMALVELGVNLVLAAEDGRADEHLAYVLRNSTLDESTGEYRP